MDTIRHPNDVKAINHATMVVAHPGPVAQPVVAAKRPCDDWARLKQMAA